MLTRYPGAGRGNSVHCLSERKSPTHNSWEPESNVVNAPEIVADYWNRQAEKQAGLGALMQA
jgi:hypothetical protein